MITAERWCDKCRVWVPLRQWRDHAEADAGAAFTPLAADADRVTAVDTQRGGDWVCALRVPADALGRRGS